MRLIDADAFVISVVKSGFGVEFINKVTALLIDAPIIEPCKDAISRKWLIDNIEKGEEVKGGIFDTDSDSVKNFINVAPSVTVESKQGEWTNAGVLTVQCSNCKSQFHELEAMNFCPNCGCDMRKGADDE